MTLKATMMTVAKATMMTVAALVLLGTGTAQAQNNGILACQIQLSQFADDVYASKDKLSPSRLALARQAVDVGRSQCRSSPDLVNTNVQSLRRSLALNTGSQAGNRFDDFWPADPQELAQLR